MAMIIDDITRDTWKYISDFKSLNQNLINNLLDTLFSDKKETSEQNTNFYQVSATSAAVVALSVFLYFSFTLLIRPAIESTELFKWLKNLPGNFYLKFLTLPWFIQAAVWLTILIAISYALHIRKVQHEESRTAAVQKDASKKALKSEKLMQAKQLQQKIQHELDSLKQTVHNAEQARTQIETNVKKNEASLKTQINQIRDDFNLQPIQDWDIITSHLHEHLVMLTDDIQNQLNTIPRTNLPNDQLTTYISKLENQIDTTADLTTYSASSAQYGVCTKLLKTLCTCKKVLDSAKNNNIAEAYEILNTHPKAPHDHTQFTQKRMLKQLHALLSILSPQTAHENTTNPPASTDKANSTSNDLLSSPPPCSIAPSFSSFATSVIQSMLPKNTRASACVAVPSHQDDHDTSCTIS